MFRKKGIPVELDRRRYLRLDLEGMVRFENLTGKPIFVPSTMAKLTPEEMGILIWCCLLSEGLTLEEAGKIVLELNEDQWNEVAEKIPLVFQDARIQK